MAIREFGESLLQDARKRSDRADKADRKREKREKILNLGVAGLQAGFKAWGSSKLSKQWNNFNKNADVLNTNIMLNSAENVNTNITALQSKITESGSSPFDYFRNQTVTEILDQQLTEERNIKYNKDDASRKSFRTAYRPQIIKLEEIKTAADVSVKQYEDALVKQAQFKTSGTREDAQKLAKSELGNRFTVLFNQRDKQEAAVEEYRNSLYAKSAKSLIMFDKIFKETGGDFTSAIQLSKDFKLDANLLEQLDTTGSNIQNLGDGRLAITQTITNAVTGEVTHGETIIKDFREEGTQVLAQLGKFNAALQLQENITNAGISEMLSEEKGFTMSPTTQIELDNNNKLYDQYYLSHRLPTVSKAEVARRLGISNAQKILYNTDAWKESVNSRYGANGEIIRLKTIIKSQNPEATEEELKRLYTDNAKIKTAAEEIAIIIDQQQQAQQSIYDQYPAVDSAEHAGPADNGITILRTTEEGGTGKGTGVRVVSETGGNNTKNSSGSGTKTLTVSQDTTDAENLLIDWSKYSSIEDVSNINLIALVIRSTHEAGKLLVGFAAKGQASWEAAEREKAFEQVGITEADFKAYEAYTASLSTEKEGE